MKLLPQKKDIDREKNLEIRKEIESGGALATRIDKLRETKANEEKALFAWRDNSLKLVQKEIDDYIIVRDNLKKQTEEAEVYRKKLIEPLDKDWEEINKVKAQQVQEKQNIFLLREEFKEEKKLIDNEKEKIKLIATKIGQKNNEIEKAKSETISLKEMAQKEYEMARSEHTVQTEAHERTMREVDERLKEYQVALALIKIRENEINEKEVDIIKREKHLESQQIALRIAKEVINK